MTPEKRRLAAWLLADLSGVARAMGPLHPIRHVYIESWMAIHGLRHGIPRWPYSPRDVTA